MRAVVQRVASASVSVDGTVVGKIGRGLCVLVGLTAEDDTADMDVLIKRIVLGRYFAEETPEGPRSWAKSVADLGYEVLLVSQFTLYGEFRKSGNKPDFHKALKADVSEPMWNSFVGRMRTAMKSDSRVQTGVFGAMMDVSLLNDGPVTFMLDSKVPAGASS